jgi:predicted nucleotidyltransferase
MDSREAIARLREHEADLKKMGVKTLYLFGSTARNEQTPDSDLDLFFDYEKGTLGLVELIRIKDTTSRLLGCKTDTMTRGSINRYVRHDVEKDAVRVF